MAKQKPSPPSEEAPQPPPPPADPSLAPADDIVDPFDGEIINRYDADDVIAALAHAKDLMDKVSAYKSQLTMAALDLLGPVDFSESKTHRLRGERHQVKIVFPSDGWDQKVLKHVWASHPELAPKFMRISEVAVNLKDYKKALLTKGSKSFMEFIGQITAANRGPVGNPSITIEEV